MHVLGKTKHLGFDIAFHRHICPNRYDLTDPHINVHRQLSLERDFNGLITIDLHRKMIINGHFNIEDLIHIHHQIGLHIGIDRQPVG